MEKLQSNSIQELTARPVRLTRTAERSKLFNTTTKSMEVVMEKISVGSKWFVHLTSHRFDDGKIQRSKPIIVEVIHVNPGLFNARVKTKSGSELSVPLDGFWLKAPDRNREEVTLEGLANKFNSCRQ
jgi:hypothetical protein